MGENLESRLYIVSKLEIPGKLRKRIRNFARDGKRTHGPIEVKRIREYPTHYSVSLVLHRCVRDDSGAHNFEYRHLRFEKRYA